MWACSVLPDWEPLSFLFTATSDQYSMNASWIANERIIHVNPPDYLFSLGERPCHLSAVDLTYQEPCFYSSSWMCLPVPYLKTNCYHCLMTIIALSPCGWDSSWFRDRGVLWVSQNSPEVPVSCCQAVCFCPVVVFLYCTVRRGFISFHDAPLCVVAVRSNLWWHRPQ